MSNIVIYWGKKIVGDDPIPFGDKKGTYLLLMEKLSSMGHVTYITRGSENYLGDSEFITDWAYRDGILVPEMKKIEARAIYDRSAGLLFPPLGLHNVLNNIAFKQLVTNKWLSYTKFSKYFPKTYLMTDLRREFDDKLMQQNKLIVKPINGLKGKGVQVISPQDLRNSLAARIGDEMLVQEFLDTSKGIPGIASSIHDVRTVYIGKKLLWSHVRTPAPGKLTANVAQGGDLQEIAFEDMPNTITAATNEIAASFAEEYDNPIFSVDVGIDLEGEVKVFEFNDTIGFPAIQSSFAHIFTESLAHRLVELASLKDR